MANRKGRIMRISLRTKLEKLVSKDPSRPVLTHLYLRIVGEGGDRRGFLEGTDSYKLGRVPVELEEGDTEGFIPAEVIGAARKAKADSIRANGSLELETFGKVIASFPRTFEGTFPNTDQLLDVTPARINGARWTIGLNPKLLLELAEGMGAETVTLEFANTKTYSRGSDPAETPDPSPLRPIMVRPLGMVRGCEDNHEAVGLLMPIRHDPPRDSAGKGEK